MCYDTRFTIVIVVTIVVIGVYIIVGTGMLMHFSAAVYLLMKQAGSDDSMDLTDGFALAEALLVVIRLLETPCARAFVTISLNSISFVMVVGVGY